MKKCAFCGNNNFDTDKVCDRCNSPLPTTEPYTAPQPTFNQPQAYYPNAYVARRPSGLTVATEVIMIINTVLYGVMLLSVAGYWFITAIMAEAALLDGYVALFFWGLMAILVYHFTINLCMTRSYIIKVKTREPVSTAFKVCSLLFLNILTGVLMLCNSEV